ncbi:MAG: hypothetical protein A2Z06_04160 [Candidatus Glassbacteria bacterium RBG_16_58_8]|uniref:Uncharacterized protein n=1 Tax=Candidatus Glassbacteria bacterium RBG_16_58_8 TaxID=1817866 RepID=A0A1F5YCB1_9BACT|nr:MAG: hypothetical protein A2Z06_04160 [Candidatus Glassbacteria bacterium RBG_16_58_8]
MKMNAVAVSLISATVLVCGPSLPASRAFQTGPSGGETEEGILETEDISVILQGSGVWIRITPMDEEILRYCTEDTRSTYRKMLENQGEALKSDGDYGYKTFLISLQGRSENEVYFDPTELKIVQQGKFYKPSQIIPISSTFDKRILTLYGTPEMAIYAFSKEIDLTLPLEFKYKELSSNKWDEIIRTVGEAKLRTR